MQITAKQAEMIGEKLRELRLEGISSHHILAVMAQEHRRNGASWQRKYGDCQASRLLLRSAERLENLAATLWS